ncbi:hypothetical protein IM660_12410 [Ruania alkalisoli]|uniref:AMIN-like domain-containing protein n=1 Tax=Ruania alkalisoli TaxID=2779775 RepID=A0A7M1SPL1_9MICO|nr:hypothetical protein [Ruania alkalisoli]QOR69489.1 hypothetical protein IM660_12410 [Ruania alkalisoli]
MQRRRFRYAPAAALAAAALALAGCNGDSDGGGSGPYGAPDPATSESATDEPTDDDDGADGTDDTDGGDETDDGSQDEPSGRVAPFPADTSRDTQAAAGDIDLLLVEARTGRHEGYDRVVLEFTGSGTPGWVGEYVENPVQDGSGLPIEVDGEATIQVTVEGTRYPDKTDDYFSPTVLSVEGEAIEEVDVGGTFEGYTQVVVGVDDGDAPFRVFSLTDPTRVVIDVQHTED